MPKLYIVKGVKYSSKNSNSLEKSVDTFVGYFTNLKEVYVKFDRASIQSYSTIAKRINKQGFYRAHNCKFFIKPYMKNFNQIVIAN